MTLTNTVSVVCTGQVCMALLSLIPATKDSFHRASQEFVSCFNDRGIFSSALGAFLLGVGMSLSGAVSSLRNWGRLIKDLLGLRNAYLVARISIKEHVISRLFIWLTKQNMRTGYSYSNFYIGNSNHLLHLMLKRRLITPLERFFFLFKVIVVMLTWNQVKFRW